jgi:hypothetical protein
MREMRKSQRELLKNILMKEMLPYLGQNTFTVEGFEQLIKNQEEYH